MPQTGNEHGDSRSAHRCGRNGDNFAEHHQVPVERPRSAALSAGHFVPGAKGETCDRHKQRAIRMETLTFLIEFGQINGSIVDTLDTIGMKQHYDIKVREITR